MNWKELTDKELLREEILLCGGSLSVYATQSAMYYDMSVYTASQGARGERVTTIVTDVFFGDCNTFLSGEYDLVLDSDRIVLRGVSCVDYGYHSGYNEEAVDQLHRNICLLFRDEYVALGMNDAEIIEAIDCEDICALVNFDFSDNEVIVTGEVHIQTEHCSKQLLFQPSHKPSIVEFARDVCHGWDTEFFSGELEGRRLLGLYEYQNINMDFGRWVND